MIHVKVEELRAINNKIIMLTEYKQNIIDMLMEMNKTQDNYIKLFEKNKLIGKDIQLMDPGHIDLLLLLSRDLRGDAIVINGMDMERLKNYLFIANGDYKKSMFAVCENIDEKLIDENIKLGIIHEFIGVYKRTLTSFDIDKKIFNKYKCTICYENEVNVCLIPCGHTFCKKCSEKAVKKCFACNTEITKRTTIYLLGREDEDEYDTITPVYDSNNPTLFGTNYAPN
jgi:hypothetical protein